MANFGKCNVQVVSKQRRSTENSRSDCFWFVIEDRRLKLGVNEDTSCCEKKHSKAHFWGYCQPKALASLNVKTLGHFKISGHQRSTDFELLSTKDKRMKYGKKIFARRSVRDLQETNILISYTTLARF